MGKNDINISDYNQFGKNHKPLDGIRDEEGRQVYQITGSFGKRLRYVLIGGVKTVIKEFTKGNHKNTKDYI